MTAGEIQNPLFSNRVVWFFSSLIGGWTNPFEKYARQIGSNFPPIFEVKMKNIWNHHIGSHLRGSNPTPEKVVMATAMGGGEPKMLAMPMAILSILDVWNTGVEIVWNIVTYPIIWAQQMSILKGPLVVISWFQHVFQLYWVWVAVWLDMTQLPISHFGPILI